MQLLPAAGYRRMPWKNGGGETFEIAVSPAGTTLDAMDWRISMAVVASDGPFSSFPEVDRTLSIVDGAGMELALDGGRARHLLGPDSAPLHFPADIPTTARLTGGTVTDLNVMTRRGRYRHAVRRLTVRGREALQSGATEALLFCCSGSVACSAQGETVRMSARDGLLFCTPGSIQLSADADSVLLFVELHRIEGESQ